MNKALIAGAVVIGAVVLAKRHRLSRDGFDIESFVERMPDNAARATCGSKSASWRRAG